MELRRDVTLASVPRDRCEIGCLDVAETVLNGLLCKSGRREVGTTESVCSHHPLRSARLYRYGSSVKVADEGEPRDRIWEIVDVDPAGLQLIRQLRHFFARFVIFKVQLLFHKH